MRTLARDIKLTLIIKFSLLIILWFICFKNVEKPSMNTQQWLFGTKLHANKPIEATHGVKNSYSNKHKGAL